MHVIGAVRRWMTWQLSDSLMRRPWISATSWLGIPRWEAKRSWMTVSESSPACAPTEDEFLPNTAVRVTDDGKCHQGSLAGESDF